MRSTPPPAAPLPLKGIMPVDQRSRIHGSHPIDAYTAQTMLRRASRSD